MPIQDLEQSRGCYSNAETNVLILDLKAYRLNINILVHAKTPSFQVYANFVSPESPHLLNQAPPRPQQVLTPFLVMPHLGHAVPVPVPGFSGLGCGAESEVPKKDAFISIAKKQRVNVNVVFDLPYYRVNMLSSHLYKNQCHLSMYVRSLYRRNHHSS